jgi:glycosyltransferase involved in cell wall biosynthesis
METISGTVGEAPSHHHAAAPATATKVSLTVVIPTLNEAAQLAELLASLCWVDEVIVADGGSTDATVAIARARGAIVIERVGGTIAAQRNDAIACARNEWVFALDADERISNPLREELGRVVEAPVHAAYRVRRQNFFLGRERRRGRWGRDWQVRLFTRQRRFLPDRVHERLEPIRDTGTLLGTLRHVPYRNLRHQLDKMLPYAQWGAQDLYARGRRARLWELGARPAWRFLRDYVAYGSWLDGSFGLLTSVLTAYACFLKYAYLWELGRRPAGPSPS